jgi:pimeloyl-ACP methyl ester carboxylesterase
MGALKRLLATVAAADGTPIAFHTHGEAKGPVVLLTNGIGTTENFWRFLVAELAEHYTVVHWDYRGHGETPPSRSGDYRFEAHADDLARVSRLLTEGTGRPPVHVAFSMGVAVTLELYRRHPELVRGLALIAGAPDAPGTGVGPLKLPGAYPLLRAAVGAATPLVPVLQPLVQAFLRSKLPYPVGRAVGVLRPHAPREDIELFMAGIARMDLRAYWSTLRGLLSASGSDVLSRVQVPVTIIAAEDDWLMPLAQVEAMRDRLPHAEYVLVRDAGHAGLIEQGEEMARAVSRMLARLPG